MGFQPMGRGTPRRLIGTPIREQEAIALFISNASEAITQSPGERLAIVDNRSRARASENLAYATPEENPDAEALRRTWLALLLGVLQIVWLPLFLFSSLFWQGDKELARDSIIIFIAMIPSLAAFRAGYRSCRSLRWSSRPGELVLSLLITALSAFALYWMGHAWVVSCLMDRGGTWTSP
jgi:hypothetical protein